MNHRYPRVNEELYICGCGGSDYVNGDRLRKGGDCESAELIQADPLRVAAALRSVQSMSTLGDRTPTTTQACMRPCTDDAMPVMGAIPGVTGAWSSFGHNCWGILWAPVCGLAMAELIADGECKCLDLKPFSPARYVQRSDSLRGRKKGSVPIGEQW